MSNSSTEVVGGGRSPPGFVVFPIYRSVRRQIRKVDLATRLAEVVDQLRVADDFDQAFDVIFVVVDVERGPNGPVGHDAHTSNGGLGAEPAAAYAHPCFVQGCDHDVVLDPQLGGEGERHQ